MYYLPGHNNIVADTLSRLDIEDNLDPVLQHEQLFGLEEDELEYELPKNAYPLKMKTIYIQQQKDSKLMALAKTSPYTLKDFSGDKNTYPSVCLNNKIVISPSLQDGIVQWYHTYLCHPGESRTERTISQHFIWSNLKAMVQNVYKTCPTCQKTKKLQRNMDGFLKKEQKPFLG